MVSKILRRISIFTIPFLAIILLTSVSAIGMSSNFTHSDMSNSSFDLVQFVSASDGFPIIIRIGMTSNINGPYPFIITGGETPILFEIFIEKGNGSSGPIHLVADTTYTVSQDPLPIGFAFQWTTTSSCKINDSSPGPTTFTTSNQDHIECTFDNVFTDLFCGLPVKDYVVIQGTPGKDNLKGTNGNDLIFGFEGNDKINGKKGNDCIFGGLGEDKINGGEGNDTIFGGPGEDKINGGEGNDTIDGGPDKDKCNGNEGTDTIVNCESPKKHDDD